MRPPVDGFNAQCGDRATRLLWPRSQTIILAAQNTDNTTIKFLGWDFSAPLIAVILAALLVGVVFDELVGLVYRARRRRTLTDRKELKRLQTNSK